MNNWDKTAIKVCKDRGLELLSLVSQGGYYFVKNSQGRAFPLSETQLTVWVQQEQDKEKIEEK